MRLAGVGRVLVGLGATWLVALPGTAYAGNFAGGPTGGYGCESPNVADNANHYVWYNAVHPDTAQALQSTRSDSYDPTDVNTFVDSAWTSTTDMVAHDADYTGNFCGYTWMRTSSDGPGYIAGYTICQSLSGSACQQFYIYFDNDYMGPRTAAQEKALACHEFGHNLGLLHSSSGCMVDPLNGSTGIVAHDINEHLNVYY